MTDYVREIARQKAAEILDVLFLITGIKEVGKQGKQNLNQLNYWFLSLRRRKK